MFETFELSRFLGKPIRLFVFTRQSQVWRYCTADRDLLIGGNIYYAAQIERSEIKQTVERAKDKITIKLAYLRDPNAAEYPVTQSLGDNWFPFVPSSTVFVTCLATHAGDTDPPAVEWMGQVTQPKFTDVELELTCEPSGGNDRARNQGAKWQRGCWKSVYSTGLRGCNLVAGPIPVAGTLTDISGNDITATEFVAQQRTFVGGTATWTANAVHTAVVTALSGSDATLTDVAGIEVGSTLTWTGGSGAVTAVVDDVVTLDNVTSLAASAEVAWDAPVQYSANISGYSGTTLTLDEVTGLAVDSVVTAHSIPLWTEATLTGVAGLALTAAEFAAAPYNLAGGALTWIHASGVVERRPIMSHSGDTITVLYGSSDFDIGLDVVVVPGCPRTWTACAARNNTINYGGAIYKPSKNPTEDSMSWG